MRAARLFSLCLLLLAPCAHAAPDPVAAARAALAVHGDGDGLDGKPGSETALRTYWDALTGKTLAYLNTHPAAAAETLGKALSTDSDYPEIDAVALAPNLIGLSVSYGATSDLVLIEKRGARFAALWESARLGGRDVQRFPILKAWSVTSALVDCRTMAAFKADHWDKCGPIAGSFRRLPPDRARHARFAIEARYAQWMGATVGGQLGIWSWDGKTATPLLVKAYSYMIDQKEFVRLDGNVLRVREKAAFKTFFACGACEGRQLDWSVRIDPDRVTGLGEKSVVPELDAVDALVDAMRHGKPTTKLASASIVRMFRPIVSKAVADARQDKDHYFSLGMLTTANVEHHGTLTALAFATDQMDKPVLIAIQSKSGRLYLACATERTGCTP